MTDINNVTIVGRLVKNAEFRHIGGVTNARFTLAVSRGRKNGDKWEEETSFIDVQAWGKLAEFVADKLTKGKQVMVQGSLRQERWESNGEKKQRVIIVADNIQIPFAKETSNDW